MKGSGTAELTSYPEIHADLAAADDVNDNLADLEEAVVAGLIGPMSAACKAVG